MPGSNTIYFTTIDMLTAMRWVENDCIRDVCVVSTCHPEAQIAVVRGLDYRNLGTG